MKTVLHELPYLKIELDKAFACLMVTWTGYTTSEQFRAGVDKIIELMGNTRLLKVSQM